MTELERMISGQLYNQGDTKIVLKMAKSYLLCSNVTVCPGVTIGDNAVIGAGSVVTRDIPANVFACGVPCKVIREITEEDRIEIRNEQ